VPHVSNSPIYSSAKTSFEDEDEYGTFLEKYYEAKTELSRKKICPIGIASITDSNGLEKARTPAVAVIPGTYRLSHSTLFKTWSL
jgi:hypothetical protein